jgi:TonB family protein
MSRQHSTSFLGGVGAVFEVQPGGKVPRADSTNSGKMKSANADAPPEITEKPSPGYTAAARAQKVEGVVRVRAQFRADGTVKVMNILNSLGYGLDELAIAAVKHIHFKPGKHNGQEVDCVAVLDVEFRLAG